MSRVTLREVAEASRVSRATVSFVLNDTPGQTISPDTRRRVQKVASELGYVPHGIAKALREGASRIVVLYVDAVQEGNYSRSFIRGLDEELERHDHVLLVRHADGSPSAQKQVLDTIAPRAVLVFGAVYGSGQDLEDSGGGWRDGLAAHTATQIEYLAGRGHRHVALAVPEVELPRAEARLRFSNETAERLGIPPVVRLAVPRPRGAAGLAVATLRSRHPEVTAVAAFDDDVALRVLAAMRDLGFRAPEDLAVIGYDSTDYGALTTPALTTVHIDAEAHGRLAARRALLLDISDVELARGHVLVRESA